MSLFSEKVLISNRCISGLMPNLIKKSWTVSSLIRFEYSLNCNPSPPLFSAEFSTVGLAVLLDDKEVSISDFSGFGGTFFLGPLTFSQHLSNLDSQQILLSGQVPNLLVHEKKSQVQSAMEKEASQCLNTL